MKLAFIGGTGLYKLGGVETDPVVVETHWGVVRAFAGQVQGNEVVFLPRHGTGHTVPPHQINYRANVAALKKLGVTAAAATTAVGTLTERIPPGSLALLGDLIDQTKNRTRTFFDHEVIHLDYSVPYCPHLRRELATLAAEADVPLLEDAVYCCTEGPRFETPAEIRAYRTWGAEVVGMTNVPEAILMREAEICYAVVAVATNWAAGISPTPLTHSEVEEAMAANLATVTTLFTALAASHEDAPDCPCRHALDEYRERTKNPKLSIPV